MIQAAPLPAHGPSDPDRAAPAHGPSDPDRATPAHGPMIRAGR
jgi:hypothetical protein